MQNPPNLVLALVTLLAISAFAANPTTPFVAGNPGYLLSADGTAGTPVAGPPLRPVSSASMA